MTSLESSLKITTQHMDLIRVWRVSEFADKPASEQQLFDLYSKFYSWLNQSRLSEFQKLLSGLVSVGIVLQTNQTHQSLESEPGARFILQWDKIYELIQKGAVTV